MNNNSLNKKDKFSNLTKKELVKIIKMLTIEIDGGRGIPIPYGWSEKIMRQFIRFCYRNLKENFIAKVEVVDSFERNEQG